MRPGEIVLVPSRTRRLLLEWAGAVTGGLALALAAAGSRAGLCAGAVCAISAAVALWQARQGGAVRSVPIDPTRDFQAQSASRMRIVFFAAQRHVVVWHDATDPATYRRLAILARWQPRGQSR
jgi:hypothetical protein